MPDSTKLKTLRDLRYKLQTDQIPQEDRKKLLIVDTDGAKVPLSDENALAVLDRRIAAEEAAAAQVAP